MANLVEWITCTADDERIEAIVIGDTGWGAAHNNEEITTWDSQRRNVVLSWDEARPMLDYEFNSGFGAPSCNAIYAWTPTRVIFISQYDGSTRVESIPRHPINCEPSMPGG